MDPEDILGTSLETLYNYKPITYSSTDSVFTHTVHHDSPSVGVITITLRTPDTHPSNWALHASSIWAASLYVAKHLPDIFLHERGQTRLLELGAGAGLPGIVIAKTFKTVLVTLSDYPDDNLIDTISENIRRNDVTDRCRVIPYAWGSDISTIINETTMSTSDDITGFDVIIAADTIWNPELHDLFIATLGMALRKTPDARVHLISGLHTGRYTIDAFLCAVGNSGLCVESAVEREVDGELRRKWDVGRADDEDEQERRRWVVWICLRWK